MLYVFMNLSLQRKKNGLCEQDCQERSFHLPRSQRCHQRGEQLVRWPFAIVHLFYTTYLGTIIIILHTFANQIEA